MKSMKKCYLDANFLIFLHDCGGQFYSQAEIILKNLITEGFILFASPLVLDEFLMGSLRLSGKSASEMKKNLKLGLKTIFKIPNFNLVSPPQDFQKHLRVVNFMAEFNLKPRDAYHLLTMRENKIKYFATFDNDFEQVFKTNLIKKFVFKQPTS